ncbi:MAG: AIR synthase family protein [Eubacteriaceae bacterium]
MEIGKLTNEQLDEIIFSKIKYKDDKVLVGSGIGEDCSVLDFKNDLCVISTDPITATTNNLGKLSVHISCNDVASKGVKPFAIMVTILAPPKCHIDDIKELMQDIMDICNQLQIELIGGHTEITDAVNRIVISTTCIGSGSRESLLSSNKIIKPGDNLIMTKYAGCEGTVILFNDFEKELKAILDEDEIKQVKYLEKSISVIKEGILASKVGVKEMHDVTEGGILGAAWELAEKAKLGVNINVDNISLLSSTVKISQYFNIDPLKLISSGAMLMVVAKEKTNELIHKMKENNIDNSVIGEFYEGNSIISSNNKVIDSLEAPNSDELYKVYI